MSQRAYGHSHGIQSRHSLRDGQDVILGSATHSIWTSRACAAARYWPGLQAIWRPDRVIIGRSMKGREGSALNESDGQPPSRAEYQSLDLRLQLWRCVRCFPRLIARHSMLVRSAVACGTLCFQRPCVRGGHFFVHWPSVMTETREACDSPPDDDMTAWEIYHIPYCNGGLSCR